MKRMFTPSGLLLLAFFTSAQISCFEAVMPEANESPPNAPHLLFASTENH